MIFLQNKFFFNLYLRWHVLRSYRFVAEVTFKLFYLGSKKDTRKRLIYAKLMIVFTPNVEFCFYFEVIHGYNFQANERLKKNTEKWSTIQFDVFDLSFVFSIPIRQAISVINRSGACYFSHVSNLWHVCWHVRVQSHTSNGQDWYRLLTEFKCVCGTSKGFEIALI